MHLRGSVTLYSVVIAICNELPSEDLTPTTLFFQLQGTIFLHSSTLVQIVAYEEFATAEQTISKPSVASVFEQISSGGKKKKERVGRPWWEMRSSMHWRIQGLQSSREGGGEG
ncbi:hypothetical protein CDAR_98121 [Caerostris darwini]|uniref:Uncharacterized protein n=1 Tax=Caerostris darwini TaxID=1538125 RepID=A0AAV4UFK3_9ARAC|nr:hypothetical protein CDAR_98121 [Caerostris darwini]